MKELIEIIRILGKKKNNKIEVFDLQNLRQSGGKLVSFYNALKEGLFDDDKAAAAFLYGTTPGDDRYRQLKSRFRRRLLNTFFLLDVQPSHSPGYGEALQACNRQLAMVYAFKAQGAVQAAMTETIQLQRNALKYNFAEIVTAACLLLMELYSEAGDEKRFKEQKALLQRFQPILDAERKSEILVQTIRMAYRGNAIPPMEALNRIAAHCEELLSFSEKYKSPLISMNAFEAWMLRFELEGNFEPAEQVAEQAEAFFRKNPLWAPRDKQYLFLLGRLRAALHHTDFKKGKIAAERAFRLIGPNDPRRFELMELLLLLSIHSGNYLHAFAVYKEAIDSKVFITAPEEQKNKWQVITPFVHLLMEMRAPAQRFALLAKKNEFSMEEFIEGSIPYLPKKENQTFLIAVAQILFLLHSRNLSAASVLIEWLYNLFKTSSRKDGFRRQQVFAKLLHKLHLTGYQPEGIKQRDALPVEFQRYPFRYRGQISHLEVIPYEKLWKMVLGFFE